MCPAGQGSCQSLGTARVTHRRELCCRAGQPHSNSHLQSRQSWQQTPDYSWPKWQSSPKEPLEIAISLPALSIHLNHGSQHYPVLNSQPSGPDCIQDIITKDSFQHLTPQLITPKNNCKIKIKYCFYKKSPTQNFLCQPKELEHSEPSVIANCKAENELSTNNSCLAYLYLCAPLSLGYFYIGLLVIPLSKASKIMLPKEVSHLPKQAKPGSCSLKSFLPFLHFPS